ncbi:MAG: glycosyltransferase family 39 protein [Saprospiraceae bacterium]|nr:glycosyltransferase family 39 protein [Lewinella sp.]
MSRRQVWYSASGLLLFLLACYFPLFLHLDSLSLRLWDEARRGVNAWTMVQEGHWLVPHFLDTPDNWGTKPPLLIWLQAFFLKVLDAPELAIRLPSALAGLATALLLAWAGRRIFAHSFTGYFSALVLLTSTVYFDAHGAVAGDYDALLTLWLTGHLVAFLLFVQERQYRWLYISGICMLLAGWTKGIAAFFFLPGLLLFLLTDPALRPILKDKRLYLTAVAAGIGIISYYLIRESLFPGYLQLVWDNEMGGRYFEAREGHGWGWGYYFRQIHKYQLFFPWQYFLPLGFWLLIRTEATRRCGKFLLISTLLFLLVISAAATKLRWYILPLIPVLSMVVGVALDRLLTGLLRGLKHPRGIARLGIIGFFLLAVFAFPYISVVNKVYHARHSGPERERMLYRDFFRQLPPDTSFVTLLPAYNGHFTFYQQYFNEKGYNISATYLELPDPQVQAGADTVTIFPDGALVAYCEKKAADFLKSQYQTESMYSWESCRLLQIKTKN